MDFPYFASLKEITQEADSVSGSAINGSRENRKPIKPPNDLDVYSLGEKIVIFFTPFREKILGDTYRYQ